MLRPLPWARRLSMVCRVEIVFLAVGWHTYVGSCAPGQNSSCFGRAAQVSFTLSPTKLASEFAKLHVVVAVAGWRRSWQMCTPPANGRVDAQQDTVPVRERALSPMEYARRNHDEVVRSRAESRCLLRPTLGRNPQIAVGLLRELDLLPNQRGVSLLVSPLDAVPT